MLVGPRAQPSRSLDAASPARLLRTLSGRVCQIGDIAILSGGLLAVAMLPMSHHRLGISIRNVLIGAMCAATWRMILISVGIYSPSRTQSLLQYSFRFFIGLNCCAAVVGLVEAVLRTGIDIWRAVGIYWAGCLLAMALVRGVLVIFDQARRRTFSS